MSLVTRGLGGNALVTLGLGDVFRRLIWVMRTRSLEPALVGASTGKTLVGASAAAANMTSSVEPDLDVVSRQHDVDISSTEPDLDGVTVEPIRQAPL